MTTVSVPVAVPDAPYEVVVGAGIIDDLAAQVHAAVGAQVTGVALVTSAPVDALMGDRVARSLREVGPVRRVVVDDGEQAKHVGTLTRIWDALAAAGLDRGGLVVAVGGGVVGDLVGFAAATWMRGVRLVHVPTTLLAQVDSAVGGKTGMNLPSGPGHVGGKNLVGAFHQPVVVVADVDVLATLPSRELRAGLGEVVKYGWIADPTLLGVLDRHADEVLRCDADLMATIVVRSVRVKAAVVAGDEREAGRRMLLNHGHTVGHAVETLTGYRTYLHGEAVGLGMVAEAVVAERCGVAPPGTADAVAAQLRALGLPTTGAGVSSDAVWAVMGSDKKTAAGVIRMALCERPGAARVVAGPPREAVAAGVARIR